MLSPTYHVVWGTRPGGLDAGPAPRRAVHLALHLAGQVDPGQLAQAVLVGHVLDGVGPVAGLVA